MPPPHRSPLLPVKLPQPATDHAVVAPRPCAVLDRDLLLLHYSAAPHLPCSPAAPARAPCSAASARPPLWPHSPPARACTSPPPRARSGHGQRVVPLPKPPAPRSSPSPARRHSGTLCPTSTAACRRLLATSPAPAGLAELAPGFPQSGAQRSRLDPPITTRPLRPLGV
nr:pistil-specific extensin-like protein [Aegilops tauschii subsp. strangulata]